MYVDETENHSRIGQEQHQSSSHHLTYDAEDGEDDGSSRVGEELHGMCLGAEILLCSGAVELGAESARVLDVAGGTERLKGVVRCCVFLCGGCCVWSYTCWRGAINILSVWFVKRNNKYSHMHWECTHANQLVCTAW